MMTKKRSPEKTVRDIRRATRRHYSAEEKIRVVLEGLRGEDSIAELCRHEGINSYGEIFGARKNFRIVRKISVRPHQDLSDEPPYKLL